MKVVKIDGMMCNGCSTAVKEALESFDEIKSAVVSHENGTAEIEFEAGASVSDEAITKAIEDLEFVVTEI